MSKENDLNIDDITLGNLSNPESALLTSTGEEPVVQEEKEQAKNQEEVTEQPENQGSEEAVETTETAEESKEEGTQFNVDDEGNLINEEGEVVYKKGDFEVVQNEDGTQEIEVNAPEDTVVLRDLIKDNYGLDLVDSNGENLTYENSHEGLVQMINDASELKAKKMETETFAAYPQAKAFLNHLSAGYDANSFFDVPTDYSNISIPEETEQNANSLKSLYRDLILAEYRERYNYNSLDTNQKAEVDKQADAWFTYQQQAGTDRDTAITAQKLLAAKEQQITQQRDAHNKQVIEQRAAEEQAYWNNIKDAVVTKGVLGNIKIPANDRESFYNYISKGVNEYGHTQEFIDASQTTEDNITLNMQLALLRYLKFDINKLVKMEVAQDKVKELKLLNSKRRIKLSGSLPVTKVTNDIAGININNLHGRKKN
tara:strand:- start:13650 stop:14930 length:1281 start_codon:yes stop_codon:yes gene_type:complete